VGEKKQIVREYVSAGLKVEVVLAIVELRRHHYYPGTKQAQKVPPGRPVTTHTKKYISVKNTELVEDKKVVEEIEKVLEDPDTQYGYRRMCAAMMLLGYMIGPKKVYRLMKENGLLQPCYRPSGKARVRGRKVQPGRPLEVIAMDIKQVWIEELSRSAYILNIIDTFTRTILYRSEGYQMKQAQITEAWKYIIITYLQPADLLKHNLKVEIRNDNGPQFAAKMVRDYLQENGLNQVFTYPYCPEQNGHVESFHSILSQHLDMFHFETLEQLTTVLDIFYEKYNCKRLHGSIACLPPKVFWKVWEAGLVKMSRTEKGKVKFKITVPYWKLSGNGDLREFSQFTEARRAS
jgi:transposase InsO family protein